MVLVNFVFKDICILFKQVIVRRINRYEYIYDCYKYLENDDRECLKFIEYLRGEQRLLMLEVRELVI